MEPGGVKVELDGDGSKVKKAVAAEMLKRHPPKSISASSNRPVARMPPGLPTFAPPRLPPVLNSSGALLNLALPSRPPPPPPIPSRSSSSHLDGRSYPPDDRSRSDDRPRSSDSRSHPSDRPPAPPLPPGQSPPPPPPPPRDPPATAPQGPRSSKRFSDFSSYPSNQSNAVASTSTALPPMKVGGYKGAVGGAPTAMAMAVAAAVQQAKRRFESKQAKASSRSTRDDQGGEKDMEMDSSGHDDSSEESDKEEKVYFHRDSQRRNHEQRSAGGRSYGVVPAAGVGVEWQASAVVLREKLAANGHSHIFISKTAYYEDRRTRFAGNVPVLNGEELRRHFEEFELDQVSLSAFLPRSRDSRCSTGVCRYCRMVFDLQILPRSRPRLRHTRSKTLRRRLAVSYPPRSALPHLIDLDQNSCSRDRCDGRCSPRRFAKEIWLD